MVVVMRLWLVSIPFTTAAASASYALQLDQAAHTYTTPKAIAGLLRTQFTFARDEVLFGEADHWQIPEEFAARKTGDCEDYALLAQALLRRNGIDAFIFSLFGEDGYAHTVGVFVDEQGHYNVIDASRIRYVRAKSLDALASWLHPAWSFGGIVEQEGHRGRMITRITNPHPVSFLASVDPLSGPPVSF